MSDQNNKDDQEEFEVVFSSSNSENAEGLVNHEDDVVTEVVDDYSSSADSSSVIDDDLADFSDIDDGVDEAGIFAAPMEKRKVKKKSSSPAALALVALLAVGGAGGYFYSTNPEILTQIKNNFSSVSGVTSGLSDLEIIGETLPVAPQETTGVVGGVDNSVENQGDFDVAMPPQPEPFDPMVSEDSSAVATDMPPPPVVSEAPVVISEAQAPALDDLVPVVDAPVSDASQGNAKIIRPQEVAQQKITLVDDLTPEQKQGSDVFADDVPVPDTDTGKSLTFFDAPPGKIMAGLPAPTMDVKRGKTESIIVVSSNKSSKSNTSSKKMNIQMTSLDERIVAAGRALKLGRYDAAKELYDELYALNPRDARVLMGRAILFQKLGESDRAISTYEEVLAISPDNAEAIVNLAGLVRKEHPAVALNKLLDLRQKYPGNAAIAAQLGVAYADSGNVEDAFRYLDLASTMEPNNAQHYFNMAIVAERARDLAKAIKFYEKSLEVDAIHGGGASVPREVIYDRLTRLRGH
ncbi:MAG: tetratricopeptide repeat protein [Alphaproteobacteria bacterium]|jgi:Flp pilus assembly protein TadD|nr:tetratricopeptide repeat protein [Alphaproteobacteria bacterium]